MGIGYDSVNTALHGGFAASMLLMLLLGKVLATSFCIGPGVPGGSLQANLQEAAELLEQPSVEVLVVKRMSAAGPQRVFGVLTPDTVSRACRDRAST